jgi:crotonobetainyl-CoA:carnitine CoA-transferase CaiB-like acyl-CoA transferase
MISDARVLDLSTNIAGPYCTKLLADAGADVVKVEPEGGDPLRHYGSGALFEFLNTSKRSVTGDWRPLARAADLAVVDGPTVPPELLEEPDLTVLAISPFGTTGPWRDRPATEFTLQAWCGSTGTRGTPDRPPIAAGGRIGEFEAGAYAAVAAAACLYGSPGAFVDLSILEAMTISMNTYGSVFATFAGWEPGPIGSRSPGPERTIELPSIEPTADGYVGFCTITAQQFADFLVLIGRPDLVDDADLASAVGRTRRMAEFLAMVHAWTTKRTTAEVIEQASLLRIPVAPIGNGATIPNFDHFVERGTFVPNPSGRFIQPRVPYRITGRPPRPFAPAPTRPGEHNGTIEWLQDGRRSRERRGGARPLEGTRILDFTAFWAGPAATCVLGALGADVIKVEAIQRPDGIRFATPQRPTVERWWEWGPLFHAINVNKRGITLDLSRSEGIELAKRLVRDVDVVIENFTPRVMENFGLTWEAIHELNPRVCMVRIPAFGLDGPWRDRPGFAQTMEQVSGMAWVTGFPDGPPIIPRGACDPLGGMHAAFALLVALEERDRTGEGRLVEVTMVEAALNAAAEQVIEHSATGRLLNRQGNRGPVGAPQGLYRCGGPEEWLALAVATDEQWRSLRSAMGEPPWAQDSRLDTAEGRRAAHDEIDAGIAEWAATRDLDETVELLVAAGVPAAPVVMARDVVTNPQMRARGFFEPVHHEVTGTHLIPGLPFAINGERGFLRRAAPTLGRDNDDVLGGMLGLHPEELARLRESGIIGDRPVGT